MPVVLLAGMALAAAPALAANQTVTASDAPEAFTPASVTIYQGELVTWSNAGGIHNVRFDDGSFTQPNPPSASWGAPVARTFPTVGTFGYLCEVHPMTMVGTVTVNPGPPPGGGPPGTVPPPPPVPVKDTAAPRLRLEVPTSQRIVRRRALRLFVASDEQATLTATGTVSVPGLSKVYKFRQVTRKLAPRVRTSLRLRLPKAARAAVARALARRVRLTARLTLRLEDRAGNTRSTKRRVRIRP